jgi:23S rRNA (cytidine1920-2'-O)/16S rRNA (cytidine1409-2'-O)-methyltransferase
MRPNRPRGDSPTPGEAAGARERQPGKAAAARLDLWLVEHGLAPSREKARALILAGVVRIDGQREDKPGKPVPPGAAVEVAQGGCPYVSRGGLKLESAWKRFGFVAEGKVCLDVGASTGGFTDFLLKQGAAKVYAVDVGYGQLAWSLRNDPRVVVRERVNARDLGREQVPEPIDLAVVDVAFISLGKVMPAVAPLLGPTGEAVCLVKPQFEAGPERVGKKGVVRSPEVHEEILATVAGQAGEWDLAVRGACFSELRGPEGNVEFFLYLGRTGESRPVDAHELVDAAWRFFTRGAPVSG